MEQACDGNPFVPPLNHGRLGWFSERLAKHGVKVTKETVRKWFSGETMPRRKPQVALAQILEVDEGWLLTGKSPAFPKVQRKASNVIGDGVVNVVAGFIQIGGGHPSYPEEDDELAQAGKVDLYAIIKGTHYRFHIAKFGGERCGYFIVPQEARGHSIVLGVVPRPDFQVIIYELDWETIETVGARKENVYEVRIADSHRFRQVKSFAERL